jgi:ubiquinol-cytochrome c reductase cytochrome b subunit
VVIIAFLPWLDRSPVKSIRYKGPIFKLRWRSSWSASSSSATSACWRRPRAHPGVADLLGDLLLFFLLMPWYSKLDKCKPEPERVNFK